MKKLLIIVLVCIMLAGCQNNTRQLDDEKYNAYLTYYQAILDTENKGTTCQDFDIELVANKIGEARYRYDVIIDNPKVAMYDLEVLVIVENVEGTINTKDMMPSIGIFEDVSYNMVPNQVDKEKMFVEGLDLSVVSDEPVIHLGVMVSYSKKDGKEGTTHYFELTTTYVEPEPQQPAEGSSTNQ